MKILVFDDSPLHRKSAELSLAGHDLTIVGTYDEAQKALTPQTDHEKAKSILPSLLEKVGLPADFNPYRNNPSEEDRKKYFEVSRQANELATTYPDFDVVMTDLMVPASRQAQGGEGLQFVGQEMPIGTVIALLALTVGVKNVAVVTDTNHHHHPASAAFDCFRGTGKIPGVNLVCTNRVDMMQIDDVTGKYVSYKFLGTDEGKAKYGQMDNWKGLTRGGKDWGLILRRLLGQ